jgi:hypothetical protein
VQTSDPTVADRLRGAVGVFVSLAGISASLTVLFLGMRSVMDIGGACASGGPFVPRVECPQGVPMMIVTALERLDALHRSGALTDAQYEEAKERVIGR